MPIVEGTELVNTNHFMEIGLFENNKNTAYIIPVYLQTCNWNSQLHEVCVSFVKLIIL